MTEQSQKNNNLKVGLTVFAGLVVLFIFIILIGTNDFLFSKTFNLYINLDNTAGLVNGAPVTLGGYKIGDVEAVEFVVINNKTNIRVKLRIKNEYKDQIRTDSKVRITSIGILGDKFVDITIGNPDAQSVTENSFLEVEPTLSLDSITKNIAPGLENFNKSMDNIKNVTDSISRGKGSVSELINNSFTIAGLNRIINKIDVALNAIEKKDGSIYKLLNDAELYNNLTSTSRDLKMISENIRTGKGTLGKLISDDSLYTNLNNASMQLNELLQKTQSDSTIIGGLLNDKKIYKRVNNLIDELNMLITDIKEHPEKYVKVSVF
jgi:phospholipid/cholesterol/gamma-HCH transport system substrate-binding protein